MHRVWLAAVFACACYSPATVAPCAVRCTDSADCPDGLTCAPALGVCTDGVATCNGDGGIDPMVDCDVDNFVDTTRWGTVKTAAGATGGELGKLRFRFDPTADGFQLQRHTAPIDLTDSAALIEVVQAPANGTSSLALEFRVVHPDNTFRIQIANQVIGGFSDTDNGLAVSYAIDPNQFRHLKIEHTSVDPPSVSFAGSPDRGATWRSIATVPAPLRLAGAQIEVEMATTIGKVGFAAAAEVDNFEIDNHNCIRGSFTPLVRDQFSSTTSELLQDHETDLGGTWTPLHNNASVADGFVQPLTSPAMYRTGDSAVDYDIEADVFSEGNQGPANVSVVGRADTGEQYGVDLAFDAGNFVMRAVRILKAGGNIEIIGTCLAPPPISTTERHRLRLRLRDGSLHGYIDGVEVCTVGAIDTTAGFPAIHFEGAVAFFRADNFIVTKP